MEILCTLESAKRKEMLKNVRHLMLDLNVKNVDLERKLNLSRSGISCALNPTQNPNGYISLDSLIKICDAMNCDLIIEIVPRENKDSI